MTSILSIIFGFLLLFFSEQVVDSLGTDGSWEEWWTYEGISGPDFWGRLNPEWHLCSKGHRQSPVDVDPSKLLYDPFLRPIHLDKTRVDGFLWNTGHGVMFRAGDGGANVSGGPLSYTYRLHEIHLHFGRTDAQGSEHTVGRHAFPAEVQIYGFNSDLYGNMSEASQMSQGLVAIALLIQIGEPSNMELRLLTSQLQHIQYKGQQVELKSLSVRELLPDTESYMTYDGSTTMPGCHETVTWILMNKPIYISKQQLYALRKLMQGDKDTPKAPLGNNYRPAQHTHHRVVRTNIDFHRNQGQNCPTMQNSLFYQANYHNWRQ